ncbi:hypothetical protein CSV71_15085 [Sporosarcina sp. P21c]|uniref:hypothetical protein n=1 Tax=unclassified Sporosarcina TaxID=2647733 RepID=UPI000C16D207|nr:MULTISPECIES: hypothetical protein [unclassified Sporosarcina]PIC66052.1 hypothetical protein CSV78_14370 [Sporosarcina sp. P16a]PIC82496.1 hypothetical protein CSV73_11755 [Sporosarcina sp. P1]PIC88368.1 hypothetical protein CSV71_15085 [Sporosarcina sp. P21c]PIC91653.1 hypothetical protein CSV70_14350 [Sporosarcina sp. P25]
MNKAFKLFFWGYLFVFFRLQIGIDILAAPIGYYLIYSGARLLTQRYRVAKKVEITAFIGMLISVPGVFVNLSEVSDMGWTIYAGILFIWKTIVVYYLFGTWKSIIQEPGQAQLRNRIHTAYIWYMSIHFMMMLMTAFSLNFGDHAFSTFFIIISFALVAMDVLLLFLIASLRRENWAEYKTNEAGT